MLPSLYRMVSTRGTNKHLTDVWMYIYMWLYVQYTHLHVYRTVGPGLYGEYRALYKQIHVIS